METMRNTFVSCTPLLTELVKILFLFSFDPFPMDIFSVSCGIRPCVINNVIVGSSHEWEGWKLVRPSVPGAVV